MDLFRADLFRFFTIGFAVGAMMVVASTDGFAIERVARGFVPAAEAAPAR